MAQRQFSSPESGHEDSFAVVERGNAVIETRDALQVALESQGRGRPIPIGEALLALRKITVAWRCPAKTWKAAMNQFAILYAERFLQPTA